MLLSVHSVPMLHQAEVICLLSSFPFSPPLTLLLHVHNAWHTEHLPSYHWSLELGRCSAASHIYASKENLLTALP